MMYRNLRFTLVVVCLLPGLAVLAQNGAVAKPKNPGSTPAARQGSGAAPAAGEQQDLAATDLKKMQKPPLPEFHPQQPKRIQLDNGMVVFLEEDHELPLIDGVAYVRGGSTREPADKIGLVSIFGGAWRTGGTKSKTGDQLDDELEARAARIETGGGADHVTLRLSCLKNDFDFVLDDFNDILRNPEFRQEKIEIAKNGVKTGIARRNDNLGEIAGRESNKIGYGAQSPYARVPEYSPLAAVTRQDLLAWHSQYVHPNSIMLGITGDFDSAAMEAKLRKMFEGWEKGPDYSSPQIAVTAPKPGVYFVEKSDVNQSEIRMVAPGIRRDDPDYYAIEVMNHVLGGGFSSRLFQNLRTKAGLAYGVSGGIGAPFDHPGLARLSIGTKTGTTAKAIDGLYKQIDGMQSIPVTAVELQRAKDAILNSFVFEFDSKEKVLQERMTYELYGYPADFLDRYQKGVEKVTGEDVNRVARKYLVRDQFAVLVVGKAADFDKPLSSFGQVTTLDITIPQPGASGGKEAVAASNPEGKALLKKVIEAAGGLDKLNAVKAVRRKATVTLKEQGMSLGAEITETADRIYQHINTPNGDMVMVVAPQDSFMSMAAMGGARPLPAAQRDEQINGLHRNLWYVAQHANDPQYNFSYQGKEKVGDLQASVLAIQGGGQQWRWYVDPQTGHVVRTQSEGAGSSGPATRIVDYSDWKTVDGITLAFHEEASGEGQPTLSVAIASYEFNPTVDPKIFDKPGGN